MTKKVTPEKNPFIKLQVCECHKLHLTYGSLTLHFEREEFMAYAACLNRLAAQLEYPIQDRIVPLLTEHDHTTSH